MHARHHSAILLTLRSQVLFALAGIIIKALGDVAPPLTISVWLMLLMAAMMVVNGYFNRELKLLRRVDWGVASLRGVLVFAMTLLTIYGYQNLPLAEAFTLSFLTPVAQVPLSILCLKEKVGWHRKLAVVFGFVGVLVMLQPELGGLGGPHAGGVTAHIHFMADAAMLLAALCNALGLTLLRIPAADGKPLPVSVNATAAEGVAAVLAALFLYKPLATALPDPHLMAGLMGLATVMALAVIANGEAYRRAESSFLAPFGYLQLLWAALGGWILWGEVPSKVTCLGAVLIIGAGLYTAGRERHHARRRAADEATKAAVKIDWD